MYNGQEFPQGLAQALPPTTTTTMGLALQPGFRSQTRVSFLTIPANK